MTSDVKIDGLKFDLTSTEVVEKIEALIAYRRGRLRTVERELERATRRPVAEFQERIDEHLEETGAPKAFEGGPRPDAKGFKDNVVHELKVTVEGHRRTITRLEFMRDHLVKDATFRLDWMELGFLFSDSRDHGSFPTCFGHEHDEFKEDGLDYFGPPRVASDED